MRKVFVYSVIRKWTSSAQSKDLRGAGLFPRSTLRVVFLTRAGYVYHVQRLCDYVALPTIPNNICVPRPFFGAITTMGVQDMDCFMRWIIFTSIMHWIIGEQEQANNVVMMACVLIRYWMSVYT